MKLASTSWLGGAFVAAAALAAVSGCGGIAGPGAALAPIGAAAPRSAYPSPAPAGHLYVDHNGTLEIYALPLAPNSKPQRTLAEDPGTTLPPQMAVDLKGQVVVGTTTELRLFRPPIVSLDPKHAALRIPLNPAITAIGPSGAQFNDIEFDPNLNLWLVSGVAGEITMLQHPLQKYSVAAVTVAFGVKGTKTSGFPGVLQARFDVNSTLYAYAVGATSARLFKLSFPYAAPPSSMGIDLLDADFVDPSQYLPTNPNPAPVILGQYFGPLHSPPPQQPPPPPNNVLAQFGEPLNPLVGLFPSTNVNTIVGALVADPPRTLIYTLDSATGKLNVYGLPLGNQASPKFGIACAAGAANCIGKPQHLFLAP